MFPDQQMCYDARTKLEYLFLQFCCNIFNELYLRIVIILKVEKYILKRSCLSNADFIEIQGIAGGDLGIPSAVVKLS